MARGKKRRPGKFDDTNGAARQRMKKIAKNEAKAQQQLMRDFAASKLPKKQRRKAAVRGCRARRGRERVTSRGAFLKLV